MVAVVILEFFKIKNLQNIFTAFNFLSCTEEFDIKNQLENCALTH